MSIAVDHASACTSACTHPATWSRTAVDMAKLIERRFDLDDRISLAIRWHPGDGHALYVSLTARDQRHHLVYCLDDWHMMGQRSRTPLIHDDKLADAFEDFVVGAMFATKGPAP